MRPTLTILLISLLLPGCEKKKEESQPKAPEKVADKKTEAATVKTTPTKEEEKEAIKAELTCPPGTETKHSAGKSHGSKWCVKPDGKQHGMTVRMYTKPGAKWPFEMTGNYVEDKKEGKWTYWHENGQKKRQGVYKNDVKSGPWPEWHDNGKQAVESTYLDGELHGVWKRWTWRGGLIEEGKYDRGKPVGTWTFKTEGGKELAKNELGEAGTGTWKRFGGFAKLMEDGSYLNGLRDGDWEVYLPTGKIKEKGKYKEGKKTGKWTVFRGIGEQYEEGVYKDGKRVGKWVGWGTMLGKGGKKKKTKTLLQFYKDGRLEGKVTRWRNGDLSSFAHYKNGRKHGKSTVYSFGKRMWEENYVNGVKEGKYIAFDRNGKTIWQKGQFKNWKPCGKWKCFHRGRKTKCPAERLNLPKCK
jgi:antitoxin component YwqK of YwqJK toxin-antitoxin module